MTKPDKHLSRSAAISRRGILAGAIGSAYLVQACDLSTSPADSENDQQSAEKGREAPMLADRVEAGELPPVEERIPSDPKMVEPNDRIGIYGGDWNTVLDPVGDDHLERPINSEFLMRWDIDYTEPTSNVASDYEVSEDGTQTTFFLREGLKWSDGEPFTADDIVFAYDDVLRNGDLFPTVPDVYASDGQAATVEKVDDYTVTFSFAASYGLFIWYMATHRSIDLTRFPRHYMAEYHEDYNSDVGSLAEEHGQPSWIELFHHQADPWANPDLPRLHAWIPTAALGDSTDRFVPERNPYYWKIDPEDSQLPYLDRVVYQLAGDLEVITLMAVNGEIDMNDWHVYLPGQRNRPILSDGQEEAGYRVFDLLRTTGAEPTVSFNLTHEDPLKREMFQNKDLRSGLSHAINRQEIINAVWQRQGEPIQPGPRPESDFYDEELAKQYTEFDIDAANEALDRSYPERDSDGRRLGPNGEPISFSILIDTHNQPWIDSLELIRDYFADVGVVTNIETVASELFHERREGNSFDAIIWNASYCGQFEPMLSPDWLFPFGFGGTCYGNLWQQWFHSLGQSGEEPPEEVRRQMDIYRDQVLSTLDEGERMEAMREIIAIAKEQFYALGINLAPPRFGIVKDNFHNVPTPMQGDSYYRHPAPTNPEQYFKTAE